MTNDVPYLDEVLKFNSTLYSLPALPLVAIGCLACGYALKTVPRFKNRWIPFANLVFGVVFMLLVMTSPVTRFEVARAVILGMVAWGASWYIHRRFLSKWVDERFFDPQDTTTIEKKDTEP